MVVGMEVRSPKGLFWRVGLRLRLGLLRVQRWNFHHEGAKARREELERGEEMGFGRRVGIVVTRVIGSGGILQDLQDVEEIYRMKKWRWAGVAMGRGGVLGRG
jgi:hypothetical protein